MSGNWIRRWLPVLDFKDREQEARYQAAREQWARPRVASMVLFVAGIFISFNLLDRVFLPDNAGLLGGMRLATALLLVGIWAGLRFRWLQVSAAFVMGLVAVIAYVAVLALYVVSRTDAAYDYGNAMMLVQVGVWFLGGMSFVAAAAINLAGWLAYLAVEWTLVRPPMLEALNHCVFTGALYVMAGMASWNFERLLRRNFAANELVESQRRAEQARAMRDALTGLWNKRAMEERLVAARVQSASSGLQGAVLMIDLDRFKPINDRYGHQAGDDVLVSVARRIQSVLRTVDSVGRVGGDEFIVLAEDLPGDDFAARLGERIRARIESPIRVRLHGDSATVDVNVGASIGISLFSGVTAAAGDIIRSADQEMYRDKTRRVGAAAGTR